MRTINVDEEVFAALEQRVVGFNQQPNDVLRELLNLPAGDATTLAMPLVSTSGEGNGSSAIVQFVKGEQFQRLHQAIDRFLSILGWLNKSHPTEFKDVALGYRRGNRKYFGRSQADVEQSGTGISAKIVPGSSIWVLSTLDNRTKRLILEEVLHALRYSPGDTNLVVSQIPDSTIRRGGNQLRLRQAILDTL